LTDGAAPVATEMMETLNRGSRYRIGMVPASLAAGDLESLSRALAGEGVEFLIVEGRSEPLPEDFPVRHMVIAEGEDAVAATRRLMEECPDYGPERQWAKALGEEFAVRQTPPPMPGQESRQPQFQQSAPGQPQYQQPPRPQFAQQPPRQPEYQEPVQRLERPPMPKNYLLWSVLTTILCCFAAGIVALVFSTQVTSRYYRGDYEGAERASRNAQIWIIASIVLAVISNTLYLPMMLVSTMLGM